MFNDDPWGKNLFEDMDLDEVMIDRTLQKQQFS
jgi:hypothetical protein